MNKKQNTLIIQMGIFFLIIILSLGLITINEISPKMKLKKVDTKLNEYIDNNIEMVFLMASLNKSFISSSSIKEFYSYNVDITKLVPPIVVEEFNKKKLNNKN